MRIVMARSPFPYISRHYEVDDRFFDCKECHLLGSSNGLVCVSPLSARIIVANPSTREVKILEKPLIPDIKSLCWGFGYDSSTNDYKVMLGFKKGDDLTCFQVLTLKSNVWKVIGDVQYSIDSRIGILCNGALHWVMKDASSLNNKRVILFFFSSEEEFKEIPQPDDERYGSAIARHPTMRLGVMEKCLCLFGYDMVTDNLWMMKDYNVKESWGMVEKDCERQVAVHCMKELKHYLPHKSSLCRNMWFYRIRELIGAPIFVQSLVSPYVNGKPSRKRKAGNSKMCCKDDPSVPGGS